MKTFLVVSQFLHLVRNAISADALRKTLEDTYGKKIRFVIIERY